MNHSRRVITLILITLIMLAPNLRAYSLAGTYSLNSSAITANNQFISGKANESAAFPAAVLAVAAGVGLAIVFATGVIDGWNSIHPKAVAHKVSPDYNPNDFSAYDA